MQHFLRLYPMKYQYLVSMNGYNIITQNVVMHLVEQKCFLANLLFHSWILFCALG